MRENNCPAEVFHDFASRGRNRYKTPNRAMARGLDRSWRVWSFSAGRTLEYPAVLPLLSHRLRVLAGRGARMPGAYHASPSHIRSVGHRHSAPARGRYGNPSVVRGSVYSAGVRLALDLPMD